uniref:(northern house mosquito) hypothetical protein n=1 Tax=Culex pipiens TaxID=7175 RepID=A0A8D8PEK5_CULPI
MTRSFFFARFSCGGFTLISDVLMSFFCWSRSLMMCDLVFDFQHIFLLRGLVGLLGGLVMMSWRFLNASGGFNQLTVAVLTAELSLRRTRELARYCNNLCQ